MSTCPHCQALNREGANFCRECGQRLAGSCPRCGTSVELAFNFCDQCGYALRGEDSASAPHPWQQIAPTAAAARPSSSQSAQSTPPGEAARQPSPTAKDTLQRVIPRELLEKLERARSSGEMVGERRIVTMLFCDLQGSTEAAEKLDPEDWTEIMNGAFEQMIQPIYSFEGTVARLMGDALLAFFGAPITHEDDPQRAILAGLEIVRRISAYRGEIEARHGVLFDVRVGINTGLVVVGAVGSDLRMEYSALGDAINVAARMEQTAAPGTIQVAHDTYRLTKAYFDFEALGGIEIKGKAEPMQVYRPLASKAISGHVRGVEGLRSELVDRQAELVSLRQILADLRHGVGRIACVLGEAGLGKTRLIQEARKNMEGQGDGPNLRWLDTTSLSYESNQAYGLFKRLMQQAAGIDSSEKPELLRSKLAGLTEKLDAAHRSRAARVFEALFGSAGEGDSPLDGETFRQELLEAMQGWWRTNLSAQPTVLVFDDLHWTDSASAALLKSLLPLTEQIPLVLLCVMRVERQSAAWQVKTTAEEEFHHRYTELVLRAFTEAESNELIDRLLGKPEIPDRLRQSIIDKSGGNPFFIEELVRTLIDNGALVAEERLVDGAPTRSWRAVSTSVDFEIPDNLQSLLAARMDRLEEGTRGTLQLASVIGRSFYRRILDAVDEGRPELDKDLGALVRMDLIREAARVPELAYAFRNPLTQEAVYNTILLRRRREFHRRVGEAIQALYPDQLEGLFGLLAHHFTMAGEREQAIQYSRLASKQAVALFAYEDAAAPLQSALQLLKPEDLPSVRLTLLEELGDVYRLLRDANRALPLFQQAIDLAGGLPDDPITLVRLHRKVVEFIMEAKWTVSLEFFQQASELAAASRKELQRLLEQASGADPHVESVRALAALSYDAWRTQNPPDWDAAQKFAQAAVKMAEPLDDPAVHSRALGALARVMDARGLLREHLHVAQRRLQLVLDGRIVDPSEHIDVLNSMGMARMYVGEYEAALPHLLEAAALAEKANVVGPLNAALGLRAQCLFRLDRWDAVLELEQQWRALERRYPRERLGPTCFSVALSAGIFAMRGDPQRARAYAEESYNYMVSIAGPEEGWPRNPFY